ncbi:MAG TPA: DUF2029 domain-containing protein [Dehalococcoidia bacterium]|nr:DUF2029 domain-containing protein [Dehalococcoidia bacterium]
MLRHPIRNILLIGLIIRIVLALIAVWPDTEYFQLLSLRTIISPGAGAPFDNIYPATWITLISLPLVLILQFVDPSHLTVPLSNGFLQTVANMTSLATPLAMVAIKLPLIVADILVGLLIYTIVRRLAGDKKAKFAFALWFLSPMVIIESCIFGQYDVIVALLSLLAAYLITRKSYIEAGVAFSLGFLFKPLNLFFGISIGIFLLWFGFMSLSDRSSTIKEKYKIRLRWLAGCKPLAKFAAGCIIPVIAFLPGGQLLGIGQSATTRLTWPQLGGINLWFIELIPLRISQSIFTWGHLHYPSVLIGFLVIGALFITLLTTITVRRQGDFSQSIYLLAVIALLLFPILYTYTGAHYYIPLLAFMAVTIPLLHLSVFVYGLLNFSLVAWTLALLGPVIIWLPLAVNWDIIPWEPMVNWTMQYLSLPGLFNKNASLDIRLIAIIIALTCLISITITSVRNLKPRNKYI